MSELDDAIARLELAIARLEAVAGTATRATQDDRVAAVAAAIAERIDAAIARLGPLLEREA